jgi:hypothetical protein
LKRGPSVFYEKKHKKALSRRIEKGLYFSDKLETN